MSVGSNPVRYSPPSRPSSQGTIRSMVRLLSSHPLGMAILALAFMSTPIQAQEYKGTVKSVDIAARKLILNLGPTGM